MRWGRFTSWTDGCNCQCIFVCSKLASVETGWNYPYTFCSGLFLGECKNCYLTGYFYQSDGLNLPQCHQHLNSLISSDTSPVICYCLTPSGAVFLSSYFVFFNNKVMVLSQVKLLCFSFFPVPERRETTEGSFVCLVCFSSSGGYLLGCACQVMPSVRVYFQSWLCFLWDRSFTSSMRKTWHLQQESCGCGMWEGVKRVLCAFFPLEVIGYN